MRRIEYGKRKLNPSEDEFASDDDDDDADDEDYVPPVDEDVPQEISVTSGLSSCKESSDSKTQTFDKQRMNDLWSNFQKGTSRKEIPSQFTNSTGKNISNCSDACDLKNRYIEAKLDNPQVNGEKKGVPNTAQFKFSSSLQQKKHTVDPSVVSVQNAAPEKKLHQLDSIVEKMNHRVKKSALDKTKENWTSFVTKEGLADKLEQHGKSKSNYIEKIEFLQRTDERQYEYEQQLKKKLKNPVNK